MKLKIKLSKKKGGKRKKYCLQELKSIREYIKNPLMLKTSQVYKILNKEGLKGILIKQLSK